MSKLYTYGNSYSSCPSEALAYISALETAYSGTFSASRKEVICNTFKMIKGEDTPNNSDLTARLLTSTDSRLFLYCPLDDSTSSYDAYRISVNLETGTFNNFVGGDISVNGVTGGTGKYLDFGVSGDDFGNETLCIMAYIGSNVGAGGSNDMGSSLANFSGRMGFNARNGSNNFVSFLNQSTTDSYSNSNSRGLYIVSREDSSTNKTYKNGVLKATNATAGSSTTSFNVYGHANNLGGSVDRESGREIMSFAFCRFLTEDEAEDLAYLVNYFNSNIITGGRNTY